MIIFTKVTGNKIQKESLEELKKAIQDNNDKEVSIDIKEVKEKRTLLQNRYYYGVVIKILKKEFALSSDKTNRVLESRFLTYDVEYFIKGKPYVEEYTKKAKELNTFEFCEYIEDIIDWAEDFLTTDDNQPLQIPLPSINWREMKLLEKLQFVSPNYKKKEICEHEFTEFFRSGIRQEKLKCSKCGKIKEIKEIKKDDHLDF